MTIIKDIYQFHKDMLDDTVGLIVFCICMSLYLVLLFLLFQFIESSLGYSESMDGEVISKSYQPAHPVITSTGKTTITTIVPESYIITVNVPQIDKTLNCTINSEVYSNTEKGSKASIEVSSGYFTNNYYCD